MSIEKQIDEFSKELAKLGGKMCRQDIIRRMKQISRMTAEQCAELARENGNWEELYRIFEDHPLSLKELGDKTANDILNTFLD